LAWSFYAGGCHSVLAAPHASDDASTGELTIAFFAALRRGAIKDDALRSAMLKVIKQHPHPYYWGVQLFGDSGRLQAKDLWRTENKPPNS